MKAALALLLLLGFATSVFAVGIRPARVVYPFQEGREITVEYAIINRAPIGARFAIYTCGTFYNLVNVSSVSSKVFANLDCTMAQRDVINQLESGEIDLDDAGIFLNPREEKQIIAKIKLPSVANFQPGIVETKIGAVDLPLSFRPGETVVGGIAAVEAQFWLRVPYPGKRLLIQPVVEDIEWGKKARVAASIASEGSEDVKNAILTVDILDSQGVRRDRIVFDPEDIPSGESVEYATLWDTRQVEPGTYTLLYRLAFESQSITQEAQLRIGGLEVSINSIEAQPVAKGGIAKFIINVQSKWGDAIPGVFAEILVRDKAGKDIAVVKTQSSDLKPFGGETFEAFWETGDAKSGKYDLVATVHFADKTSQGTGEFEIRDTIYQQTPVEYIALAVFVILLIALWWFAKGRIKIEPQSRK